MPEAGWRAGQADLSIDRYSPAPIVIRVAATDITGATWRAQIRLLKDNPGAALLTLTGTVSTTATGLRQVATGTDAGVTWVEHALQVSAVDALGLPFSGEIGNDSELWWDLLVTPIGGTPRRWLEGKFYVRAGVTHAS